MPAPRFQILQVVQIADHPDLASHGLAGQAGCITQIREYPGPLFRYSVRGPDPADDDEVSGLYNEQHLEPTGQTAPAELFALPGGFREGEIVWIAADCGVPEAAGRTGTVDGTYTPAGGLGIWLGDLGDSVIVAPPFVTSTGQRVPPRPVPRSGHSTRVGTGGQITGRTTYMIVDDLDQYL